MGLCLDAQATKALLSSQRTMPMICSDVIAWHSLGRFTDYSAIDST